MDEKRRDGGYRRGDGKNWGIENGRTRKGEKSRRIGKMGKRDRCRGRVVRERKGRRVERAQC